MGGLDPTSIRRHGASKEVGTDSCVTFFHRRFRGGAVLGVDLLHLRKRTLTIVGNTRTLKPTGYPGRISMTLTLDNKPIVIPDAIRRKAGLRRGDRIEFKVSGRAITIVPKESVGEDYPMETVMRIIDEQKKKPMSARELAALNAELRAYGAKQAKKAGIKERDIPRLVHEFRKRRRTS